jgi:hypothetical protein
MTVRVSGAALQRHTRQLARFAFAESDMYQASAAARLLLLQGPDDVHAARALETAMVICYARPFGRNNGIGPLPVKYAPQDERGRAMHDVLLMLRSKAYAHTDAESGREITNITGMGGGKARDRYGERWFSINRDAIPATIELCEAQADRFIDAAMAAEDWFWKNARRSEG